MNSKAKFWLNFIVATVVINLAIFLSAGTLDYWQAWAYVSVALVTGIAHVEYITKNPVLLESRSKLGPTAETRPIQKLIVLLSAIPGIALFIVPGLDHRFGWSNVPPWLVIAGNFLVILGMWMVYRVFMENAFGSATIEVTTDQKVIFTGPYAIVRNPMYSCAVVYFIGMSLALGSYWNLVPSVLSTLGLVWRLFDEEKFLAENLPGYKAYCDKVRWHLVPGIF